MVDQKAIYLESHHLLSPLGLTTTENFENLLQGRSGVAQVDDQRFFRSPFYGAVFSADQMKTIQKESPGSETRFNCMAEFSIREAIENLNGKINPERTLFILSTTKGNIDLLKNERHAPDAAFLHHSAKHLASLFGINTTPVVVSNACISGVLALNMAYLLLQEQKYDRAIVCGADIVSEFVVSGFASLMAISGSTCKPYDVSRDGINLGEACGTMILTNKKGDHTAEIKGGFTSNDANHISGPSRTGDGLSLAIEKTLNAHGIASAEIGLLNAHGTATPYNDEMESLAFATCGLSKTPMHSLKAYYGHTLGAAGIIESIIGISCMLNSKLIKSSGFEEVGTSIPLNVITEHQGASIQNVLKTASGFGGCNAAILYKHVE